MSEQNLKAAFAQFVQEHMPWPFEDVSRYADEGTDAAWDIAQRLLPHLQREFDAIAFSAKASWSARHDPKRKAQAPRP